MRTHPSCAGSGISTAAGILSSNGMPSPWRYRVFGLAVVSDLQCPELPPHSGEEAIDVVVRVRRPSREPAGVPAAGFEASPGRFDLRVPRVGRFLVEQGREISIEPDAAADGDTLRVVLLGTVMGALLHQRQVLPLQGAAICRGDRSILLIGPSGAGKSSIAAALLRHGWCLQSDDVAAVRLEAGVAVSEAGLRRQAMWPDMLTELGENPEAHSRLRPGLEVRSVRVSEMNFHERRAPIAAVVLIAPGRSSNTLLTPIDGTRRMVVLRHYTFRGNLPGPLGVHLSLFTTAARVAAQAQHWRLQRPRAGGSPAVLADMLAGTLDGP
jgi:hypothetical protein